MLIAATSCHARPAASVRVTFRHSGLPQRSCEPVRMRAVRSAGSRDEWIRRTPCTGTRAPARGSPGGSTWNRAGRSSPGAPRAAAGRSSAFSSATSRRSGTDGDGSMWSGGPSRRSRSAASTGPARFTSSRIGSGPPRCPPDLMKSRAMATATLEATELQLLDAYWRAANYLSVGQIYLLDNPLLRKPLEPEHLKPRLAGHFGPTPGLNPVYLHP